MCIRDSSSPNSKGLLSNYAFPVKRYNSKGRCAELCNQFRMTNPVNWASLAAMDLHVGKDVNDYDIEIDEGIISDARETEYGKIERALVALVTRIKQGNLQNDGKVSRL